INRKVAMDQGMARVYTEGVKTPIAKYKALASAEVDRHAQNAATYDNAYNTLNGTPQPTATGGVTYSGAVKWDDALMHGTQVMDELGKTNPKIEKIRAQLGQARGTLMETKNLMSDIGEEASKAGYTKQPRAAAVLWEMYDKLHDAVKDHIDTNL